MTMPIKNYGPYPNWSLSGQACSGNGIAPETVERVWRALLERPSGPMSCRSILQLSIAAIHEGVRDARAERSQYFWTVVRS